MHCSSPTCIRSFYKSIRELLSKIFLSGMYWRMVDCRLPTFQWIVMASSSGSSTPIEIDCWTLTTKAVWSCVGNYLPTTQWLAPQNTQILPLMFPFLYVYYINIYPYGITSQCVTCYALNHFSKTHSPMNCIKPSGKYMYQLLLHHVTLYFAECIFHINIILFSKLALSCPHNGHGRCSLWGKNWIFTFNLEAHHLLFVVVYAREDRLCGLVIRVSGYRYRCLRFDSRRYQIFWVVVGLERGPLSLVRSIEELLE